MRTEPLPALYTDVMEVATPQLRRRIHAGPYWFPPGQSYNADEDHDAVVDTCAGAD